MKKTIKTMVFLLEKKVPKKKSLVNWFVLGLSSAMLITFTNTSIASPASAEITLRLVIPPWLQARVLEPPQSGMGQHTVCIAGRGIEQFRTQNQLSGPLQNMESINSYSQPYSVNTNQLKNCSEKTVISVPSTQSGVSIGSRIMIVAE